MELEQLAILLITGGVAGWLAGLILKKGGAGIIRNVIIGVVGAFLGSWLLGLLDISFGNEWVGSLVTATIGSVVLLLIIGFITKKK